MRIPVICIVISFIIQSQLFGQDSVYVYKVSLSGAVSSPVTPFWLHSNTFGNVPEKGSYGLGQFSIHRKYNSNNPRLFQWSGGVELIANTGKLNQIFFSDLYLAAKLGPVELSAGQRREFTGLCDSILTSGALAMSSNYRPFPKINISTPNFFNVIPGNDFIAIKFSYSDGLLGPADVQYGNVTEVPEIRLHQKTIYARVGGSGSKLSLYAGFNHQAIWGGEDSIFTGGLKQAAAYKYVVFGKPWLNSRVGNHFGTIDLAMELRTKSGDFFLYRQSIYEDGSLAKLSNISDGLNGIRFKPKKTDPSDISFKVNTVLLEFTYSKNQGGSRFDYDAGIFGNDNYFNHYVYKQGWSYRGRSLGTPLVYSQALMRTDLPRNNASFTNNNRIASFHAGVNASWNGVNAILKATFSKNSGTYVFPFQKSANQTYLLLCLEKQMSILKRSVVSVSLAADIGQLLPNNTALSLGWKKYDFIGHR